MQFDSGDSSNSRQCFRKDEYRKRRGEKGGERRNERAREKERVETCVSRLRATAASMGDTEGGTQAVGHALVIFANH